MHTTRIWKKDLFSYPSDVTVQGMEGVILHLLPFSRSDKRRLGTAMPHAHKGPDVKSELISSCPVTEPSSAPLVSLRRLAERNSPMVHLFYPGEAGGHDGG